MSFKSQMAGILTLGDASAQRHLSKMPTPKEEKFIAQQQAKKLHDQKITHILQNYPEIGRLNSGKFYAFVDGYDNACFESRDIQAVVNAVDRYRVRQNQSRRLETNRRLIANMTE